MDLEDPVATPSVVGIGPIAALALRNFDRACVEI
jgi:hypothetical protein